MARWLALTSIKDADCDPMVGLEPRFACNYEIVAFGRKSDDEMFGEENDAKARRGPGKHSWMSDNCQGGGFGAMQCGS